MNVTRRIISWLSDASNNFIEPGSAVPAFAEPLIGISSGADELYEFLKKDIAPDAYWTPQEAFSYAYPDQGLVDPESLRVIAWVLPQTQSTRQAHRKAKTMPSKEWSKSRHYGEIVNEKLRAFVVELFLAEQIQACAPVMLPHWSRIDSVRYGFASCWSERHAAYICGLGTFGLSDGLITAAGKAVRIGSVIVKDTLETTPRPYSHHNEWCLFHSKTGCNACIKRCPAGAISETGHDKEKCKKYIREVTALHVEEKQLGFKVNSCGLCQTKVPCEAENPVVRERVYAP